MKILSGLKAGKHSKPKGGKQGEDYGISFPDGFSFSSSSSVSHSNSVSDALEYG